MWLTVVRLLLVGWSTWTSPEAEAWREYQNEIQRIERDFDKTDREFDRLHQEIERDRMRRKDKP